MKECPNCKTMLEDDELFCHECGAKQEIESVANQKEEATTPLEKKCIHCGETIDEDSTFCPYCGKSQVVEDVKDSELKSQAEEPKTEEEPVAEEKIAPKEEEPKTESKKDPKEASAQETPKEQPTHEEEEETKSKKWIWILLAILLFGVAVWYFISPNNDSFGNNNTMAEAVDTDSIEEPDEVDEYEEITPTSPLAFLEQFYKSDYKNEEYIKQHVTANVINKLKRDYDYECPSGDCLATWVFTAYPAGVDLELEEGPIISETQVDGKFKVDFKYSGYNGNQKQYQTNTIFLTVDEIDGNYLISNYELLMPDIEQKMDDVEDDEDALLNDIPDSNITMAGKVSKYGIHMILAIRGTSVTGYYYYDSQGNGNKVTLKGSLEDDYMKLKKYSKDGAEIGYFEGEFDGIIYDGKNVNYNRDEALPFSVEIVD